MREKESWRKKPVSCSISYLNNRQGYLVEHPIAAPTEAPFYHLHLLSFALTETLGTAGDRADAGTAPGAFGTVDYRADRATNHSAGNSASGALLTGFDFTEPAAVGIR